MVELDPRLMVITDARRFGVPATLAMARRICSAASPGNVVVQLRDRELSERARHELALELHAITRAAGQSLSVNERADLAWLVEAQALHLPESGVTALQARKLFTDRRRELWLSRAWHGELDVPVGVDALVVAPVCEARKGRAALGLGELTALCRRARGVPVYALGGVDATNAAQCLAAGARGVAAISAAYTEGERLIAALGIARGGASR